MTPPHIAFFLLVLSLPLMCKTLSSHHPKEANKPSKRDTASQWKRDGVTPENPSQCLTSTPSWVISTYGHILPAFKSLSIHNMSLWLSFLEHLHRLDNRGLWRHTPAYSLPPNQTDILDFILHRQLRDVRKGEGKDVATLNIAIIGGSFARGVNCGDPIAPLLFGSARFVPTDVNGSCSTVALIAHYLMRDHPKLSVTPYNLGVSGCGYMCLVESLQGYYLTPHAPTLHIVLIDVCVNDHAALPVELSVTYLEVIGFVRRKGGEVLFLCAWSKLVFFEVLSPRVNYVVARQADRGTVPLSIDNKKISPYNGCIALGIRMAAQYLFPVVTYQDPLLTEDASFSDGSERAFRTAVPALTKDPSNAHPSMLGNDFIAQIVSRWVSRRICHVLSLPQSIPRPPIPLLNTSATSLVKLINSEEDFESIVTVHRGFVWKLEDANKPGWISERFGSILKMELPVPVLSGFLSIGYLQTYTVIGLFNLTVKHQKTLLMNKIQACIIRTAFSQTAFVTIPFNVTHDAMKLDLEIEHLDHTDVKELEKVEALSEFLNHFKKGIFKFAKPNITKVKIISVGIYDSAEGAASRPRDVDYNAY
jgi:hypothetical protein